MSFSEKGFDEVMILVLERQELQRRLEVKEEAIRNRLLRASFAREFVTDIAVKNAPKQ